TKVYKKPTDSPQYLHFLSEHPKHTKTSLPYSLGLRCKRICSNRGDLEENLNNLKIKFAERSYPKELLDDAINKAREFTDAAANKHLDSRPASTTHFITTYHSSNPNFNKIFERNFNLISQNSELSSIFAKPPKTVYNRLPNLKDQQIRSKINIGATLWAGSKPCEKSRCQICNFMQPVKSIKSKNN